MVIGLLNIEIEIPDARSLKDKRTVLNRIKGRVRHRFNVSIAEIDGNDVWNYSCLGVAVVSNNQKFANQVLSKVAEHIETIRDCQVIDLTTEFLRGS